MNARASVSDLPHVDRPISELFRVTAKLWVDADAAARLLEEMKTTTLEQQKQNLIMREGDMPDAHAERRVKAHSDWSDYIKEMVAARTAANLKKAQMEFLRMRFTEIQDANASSRAEMRLSR